MLCEHYGWAPDFWRSMGWRELRGWIGERARSIRERTEGRITDVGTWAGRDRDPWWAEQDEKRRKLRGY